MKGNNPLAEAYVIAVFAVGIIGLGFAPPADQRTYWKVPIDSLATGRFKHTHVETRGYVAPNYPRREDDGDVHIKLYSLSQNLRYVIVECIPKWLTPCQGIRAGDIITVQGITRNDPEHGWPEIHPAENIFK